MKTLMPIKWKTEDILNAVSGRFISKRADLFDKISIDSRDISENDFFIAIHGENYDGHDFINDALKKRVKGIMIQEDRIAKLPDLSDNILCIAVKDTIKAIGDMAAYNRKRAKAKIVAVTGSNGKTTTREMIASVLSEKFKTMSAKKSFNNNIGVPLTLLSISQAHDWAVLEFGMNRKGEIRELGKIGSPDFGIITNVGPAHLEVLDTIENIIEAKAEILENIKPEGRVILNADDPNVVFISKQTNLKVIFFGMSEKAEVRAGSIRENKSGVSFSLLLPDRSIDIDLKVHGKFMVLNALAASSVGIEAGLSLDSIKSGLEKFRPVKGRLNIINIRDVTIIDDTYNANPASMKAALNTFTSIESKGLKIFVAGEMFELGRHSKAEHQNLGIEAAKKEIDILYANGRFAKDIADGAIKQGLKRVFIGTKDQIIRDLKEKMKTGCSILVKGSRAAKMEKIVEELKNDLSSSVSVT